MKSFDILYKAKTNIILTSILTVLILLVFLYLFTGSNGGDFNFLLSLVLTPLIIYIIILNTLLSLCYFTRNKSKKSTILMPLNLIVVFYSLSPYLLTLYFFMSVH